MRTICFGTVCIVNSRMLLLSVDQHVGRAHKMDILWLTPLLDSRMDDSTEGRSYLRQWWSSSQQLLQGCSTCAGGGEHRISSCSDRRTGSRSGVHRTGSCCDRSTCASGGGHRASSCSDRDICACGGVCCLFSCGPFGCHVLVQVLSCENWMNLYMWNAPPRSGCHLALSTRHRVLSRILPRTPRCCQCTVNFFRRLVFGPALAGASNVQGGPFQVSECS